MATFPGWRFGIGSVITCVSLLLGGATDGAAQQSQKSLYDRLGGVYAIATVVDNFIERLLVNQTLNANPRISAARAAVPKAGLKYRVTELVCQVTGGPCKYTGRDMKTAHQHLNISEAEWQAMATDFKKSLDQYQVPKTEQEELFTIVESVKPQIVMPKGSGR